MRVLTVRQPWAWAIWIGIKQVENRSRNLRCVAPGETFAIHAGRIDEAGMAAVLRLVPHASAEKLRATCEAQRGRVIALVDFVGNVTTRDDLPVADRPWFAGPVGWRLANARSAPRRFATQKLRGRLGMWTLPE